MKILKFYANWCSPCKALTKMLNSLNLDSSIQLESIDIEEKYDLADKYQVKSLPTLVFIKDGQELNRLVGNVTKDQVIDAMQVFSIVS